MIRLKHGVRMAGVCAEIVLALHVADGVWRDSDQHVLTVTSLNDGTHSARSFHYSGRAADLRVRDIPEDVRPVLLEELRSLLGTDFEVFHEGEGTTNEHFHIEYQPLK